MGAKPPSQFGLAGLFWLTAGVALVAAVPAILWLVAMHVAVLVVGLVVASIGILIERVLTRLGY